MTDCIRPITVIRRTGQVMNVWQVYVERGGFVIDGTEMAFELRRCVEADDHLHRLANSQRETIPELARATGPFPRCVINPLVI